MLIWPGLSLAHYPRHKQIHRARTGISIDVAWLTESLKRTLYPLKVLF